MTRFLSLATPLGVAYAWRQLARRAGLVSPSSAGTSFESLGINVHYCRPTQVKPGGPHIIVVPAPNDAWPRLLEQSERGLRWIASTELVPNGIRLPFSEPVPVLLWGAGYEDGRGPFVKRREDGAVVFYVDIVAATLFMLTRWEEAVIPTRDVHDRFPATASVAYRQGFLDRPIVDEYALILQAWLKVLLPGWEPQVPRFTVKLSHDIDMVRSHSNLRSAMRTSAGDLLKRRSPAKAMRTLQGQVSATRDLMYRGIFELADLSEAHGFTSAFYFMGARAGLYDRGYDPSSSLVRRCIRDLADRGHEVGFHPGYHTLGDATRFAWEKSRVQEVTGSDAMGGRQHYLRFRVPHTWRMWNDAALAYDSTLGYADCEGFRCGTCHPFAPFDIERNREMTVLEVPLTVMDVTLRQYRGLTPEEGQERILTLAERCRCVNGVFTLLWHSTSLQGEWHRWAMIYRRVLSALAKM